MTEPAKIMVVFGTRPEAIKLFPVVAALKADPRFTPVVCVSAQHRQMLDQVLEIAGIVPDHDLDLMKPDQTLDGLTAALLTELGKVMDQVQPARVIVQGDTATAMAGALAAYYRKIPVDHVEAGLRSGNIYHPWPEEVNRKIIGTIASLHFAPTEVSAKALTDEQVDPARVHVTGNTVIDALPVSPIWKRVSPASGSSASPATGARILAEAWKTSPKRSARLPRVPMWR
jgi:UDP-N-acetylglucosamine 2-epimerase (non-hydrolysing)